MKTDKGLLKKARQTVAKWKNNHMSHQAAWEELTGNVLAKSTCRKYMNALDNFLLNAKPSNRLDKIQLNVELQESKNEKGDKIYTQKSTILTNIQNIRDKSPEEMLQLHGYDPLQWELIKSINKAYQGTSKLQGTYDMFSSTVRARPLQNKLSLPALQKIFQNFEPPEIKQASTVPIHNEDIMLEFPIMDVHLGKLAWHEETGQDYDLSTAKHLYEQITEDILDRVSSRYNTVGKVLFPVGQDMFHTDNERSTTTKGTQLTVDSRWQKMFRRGCELNVWAVEKLKRHTNDIVISYVKSNHDAKMSYMLVLFLSAWFRDDPKVTINISPYPRKYYQWGRCMIGYLHKMAKKRIDKIMQSEAPKIWGDTRFRELHIGHQHIEGLQEYTGFKIRNISSITATDDWHCDKGYVNVIRQAQAFVWYKDKGLRDVINSVVELKRKVKE